MDGGGGGGRGGGGGGYPSPAVLLCNASQWSVFFSRGGGQWGHSPTLSPPTVHSSAFQRVLRPRRRKGGGYTGGWQDRHTHTHMLHTRLHNEREVEGGGASYIIDIFFFHRHDNRFFSTRHTSSFHIGI